MKKIAWGTFAAGAAVGMALYFALDMVYKRFGPGTAGAA